MKKKTVIDLRQPKDPVQIPPEEMTAGSLIYALTRATTQEIELEKVIVAARIAKEMAKGIVDRPETAVIKQLYEEIRGLRIGLIEEIDRRERERTAVVN